MTAQVTIKNNSKLTSSLYKTIRNYIKAGLTVKNDIFDITYA